MKLDLVGFADRLYAPAALQTIRSTAPEDALKER